MKCDNCNKTVDKLTSIEPIKISVGNYRSGVMLCDGCLKRKESL